jgi:tetratricopeptide (TPR) repeat protein
MENLMENIPQDPATAELERQSAQSPDDPNLLVRLANAYWLEGRGPQIVGEIATRAKTIDPTNRAAWHLWALAEPIPRDRVERWQQVIQQFPEDDLARAALADNAASLAGAEHDIVALDLAIKTYEKLLSTAQYAEQKTALQQAVTTLKGWRL